VIYDNHTNHFALKKELLPGEEYCLSLEDLSEHLDYKYKIQSKSGNEWVDIVPYARLLPESITDDGIKYLFYPRTGANKLVVVFQAINRNPGYNYVKTLAGIHAHRLYIKDEYGEDPDTRTSYYLGKHRSFDVADKVQRLISAVAASCQLLPRDCIFAGSSKGGFAALYHGYRFSAGHILPGGPQVLLGNFLNSRSDESVHPPILDYLAGGRNSEAVSWANRVLESVILAVRPPFPYTEIHVGRHEPHYQRHVVPFLALAARARVHHIHVDLGDYATHQELATHYPLFLRDRVHRITCGLHGAVAC
jgi:hypothetical protein